MKYVIVAALLTLCAASASFAQTKENVPLLSASRASVAAGVSYAWRTTPLADNSEPLLGRHAEFVTGVYAAYNLVSPSELHPKLPHVSLAGSTTIGLDSRQFRHEVGIRWRFWSGK